MRLAVLGYFKNRSPAASKSKPDCETHVEPSNSSWTPLNDTMTNACMLMALRRIGDPQWLLMKTGWRGCSGGV